MLQSAVFDYSAVLCQLYFMLQSAVFDYSAVLCQLYFMLQSAVFDYSAVDMSAVLYVTVSCL